MLNEIPVQFEYKGKHYKGVLCSVSGRGGICWDLMIDRYYYGSVIYTERYGLRFVSNIWEDDSLNDVLEFYIISWYG